MNYDIKAQIETLFREDRKKMDYEDSTVKGHQVLHLFNIFIAFDAEY